MSFENKIIIIYLIGLVFFVIASYLVMEGKLEDKQKEYQGIYSFIYGALWPLFFVYWIVQARRNINKVRHGKR